MCFFNTILHFSKENNPIYNLNSRLQIMWRISGTLKPKGVIIVGQNMYYRRTYGLEGGYRRDSEVMPPTTLELGGN